MNGLHVNPSDLATWASHQPAGVCHAHCCFVTASKKQGIAHFRTMPGFNAAQPFITAPAFPTANSQNHGFPLLGAKPAPLGYKENLDKAN